MRLLCVLCLCAVVNVVISGGGGGRRGGQSQGPPPNNNGRQGPGPGNYNNGGGWRGPGGAAPQMPPPGAPPPAGVPCPTCGRGGFENNRPHSGYYSPQEYLSLMTQVQTGNQYNQCPCVKRPGTELCMTYDPRYQAATLPEAIMNFPDLTIGSDYNYNYNPASYDPSNPWRALGYGSMNCRPSDMKCHECTASMVQHLRSVGVIDNTTISQLETQLDISFSPGRTFSCDRYFFAKKNKHGGWGNGVRPPPPQPQFGRRGKRQTNGSLAEEEHVISCVNRGEAEDDNAELLNLCSMCWVWRQLPATYFPTYVNELVCATGDKNCLTGMGKCKQRYRNLSFLQNLGTEATPNWQAVTLASGTSCECQVLKGSNMEIYVIGTN